MFGSFEGRGKARQNDQSPPPHASPATAAPRVLPPLPPGEGAGTVRAGVYCSKCLCTETAESHFGSAGQLRVLVDLDSGKLWSLVLPAACSAIFRRPPRALTAAAPAAALLSRGCALQ
jgi:hypothetical protein